MKRHDVVGAQKLTEKFIKKCNSILKKYDINPKTIVISDGSPIYGYITSEISNDKKVWLSLYDSFLENIQVDLKIKPLIFRDLTSKYRADVVIYILQTVALLSFNIFCSLVSMYVWEKIQGLRAGRRKSQQISQLKEQIEKLNKEIKKLRGKIRSKNSYTVIGNKYIQIAENIVNSKPTDVVEMSGDLKLEEIKEIVEKCKLEKRSF
ncbi:MAG: hypothetical protein IBV53_00935 [Candidatus Atribacteria bacterium]